MTARVATAFVTMKATVNIAFVANAKCSRAGPRATENGRDVIPASAATNSSRSRCLYPLLRVLGVFSEINHPRHNNLTSGLGVEHGIGKSAEETPAVPRSDPCPRIRETHDPFHHRLKLVQKLLAQDLALAPHTTLQPQPVRRPQCSVGGTSSQATSDRGNCFRTVGCGHFPSFKRLEPPLRLSPPSLHALCVFQVEGLQQPIGEQCPLGDRQGKRFSFNCGNVHHGTKLAEGHWVGNHLQRTVRSSGPAPVARHANTAESRGPLPAG